MPDSITMADRLDGFISGRASLALAFGWGLAEATFFFIVPDVLLTLLACRNLRRALKATLAALAGALIGGALLWGFGSQAPDRARAFLDYVPAINPALIQRVDSQIDERGLAAVMIGPIKGIPYKVYAVEWGAHGGGIVGFLLVSIPARYVRFFLAVLAARSIARLIKPWTHHQAGLEMTILAGVWIAFYIFYFAQFGI